MTSSRRWKKRLAQEKSLVAQFYDSVSIFLKINILHHSLRSFFEVVYDFVKEHNFRGVLDSIPFSSKNSTRSASQSCVCFDFSVFWTIGWRGGCVIG